MTNGTIEGLRNGDSPEDGEEEENEDGDEDNDDGGDDGEKPKEPKSVDKGKPELLHYSLLHWLLFRVCQVLEDQPY